MLFIAQVSANIQLTASRGAAGFMSITEENVKVLSDVKDWSAATLLRLSLQKQPRTTDTNSTDNDARKKAAGFWRYSSLWQYSRSAEKPQQHKAAEVHVATEDEETLPGIQQMIAGECTAVFCSKAEHVSLAVKRILQCTSEPDAVVAIDLEGELCGASSVSH